MPADRGSGAQRRIGLRWGAAALAIAAYVAMGAYMAGCGAGEESIPDAHARPGVSGDRDRRQPAPDFLLPDLAGNEVRLSDYRGRVVLLNFWATWCAPCRIEIPSMQRLYQTMDGGDFELLAVSADGTSPPVARFVRQYDVGFPVLLDHGFAVASHFGVAVLPVSLLIDREGRVAYRIEGAREWDGPEAIAAIRGLISEPVPSYPPAAE